MAGRIDAAWLKDREQGRPCVIVCTGPSLQDTPPTWIDRERYCVISMNAIYLWEDFVPDYWCMEDTLVAQHHAKGLEDYGDSLRPVKVVSQDTAGRMNAWPGLVCVLQRNGSTESPFFFSRDLTMGYSFGGTVTYLALQLAMWLGCRDVSLLGLDFNYSQTPPADQTTVISPEVDLDHFSPGYRREGDQYHAPRLDRHIESYGVAKKAFEARGGSIINRTPGTKLTVFDTGPWEVLQGQGPIVDGRPVKP